MRMNAIKGEKKVRKKMSGKHEIPISLGKVNETEDVTLPKRGGGGVFH